MKVTKFNTKKEIAISVLAKIPSSILTRVLGTKTIIPYYHMISDNSIPYIKHLYKYKNIIQFLNDLDYLLKAYHPITLLEFIDILNGKKVFTKNTILLTFDDGFKEMSEVVAPILLNKGVPATFFVNTDFIDNKNLCYQHKASLIVETLNNSNNNIERISIRKILSDNNIISIDIAAGILSIDYNRKFLLNKIAEISNLDFDDFLIKTKPYLTTIQINKLIRDGFTVGAHSIDHPYYATLNLDEQLFQTIESVKTIREKFLLNYGAFAFPHSASNVTKKFFYLITKEKSIDVTFGTGGIYIIDKGIYFHRFSMEEGLLPAEKILALQFCRVLKRECRGKK